MEKPDIGTQITVFGSVEFYRKAGKVTFVVKNFEETGKGKAYAEFLALKEKLKFEGLFENKLSLPHFIKRVAVVTSNTGAVIHDFLSVIGKRHSYIEVSVVQTKVQGEGADMSVADAITKADMMNADVIVIARGGGAASDLDCFNSEKVVRSVAGCKTPTVSAVGHQTDITLCDLASTQRAGTPSIAGEILCSLNDLVINRLFNAVKDMGLAIKNKTDKISSSLYMTSTKIISASERNIEKQIFKTRSVLRSVKNKCDIAISNAEQTVRYDLVRCTTAIDRKYHQQDKKLALSVMALENINPLKILSQGYTAITCDGKNIKSVSSLNKGDTVKIRFSDGNAVARVEEINDEI